MKYIKYTWRKWQFAFFGILMGCGYESHREQILEEPPDHTLTSLGFAVISTVIISVLLEFLILTGTTLFLRQKFKYNDSMILSLYGRSNITKWMDAYGLQKCSPTFEEEYVHYKYYNIVGKWIYKKSLRDSLPHGLDVAADNAKKNYLSYKLSGIVGELD